VEKSAVAIENVHQQQFGGELRGRNLVLKEGLETGLESSAELHGGRAVLSRQSSVFSQELTTED
jgi:hypothetical protein